MTTDPFRHHPKLVRFREAYLAMAEQARYRPMAPGDGMGNIHLSAAEVADPWRLTREAEAYAVAFDKEEDSRAFWVGCSNFETNRAFVWAIEAARCLAGGLDDSAQRLLGMAVKELQKAKAGARRRTG